MNDIEIPAGRRAVPFRKVDAVKANIALCMIVKNEEKNLAQAIESAVQWVDEIVVVDTGSTDATMEIAHEAGARVESFTFSNGIDLAAARTHSLNMACSDWALLLDADTKLDAASGPLVREMAIRHSARPAVICARWKNYYGSGDDFHEGFTRALLPLSPGRRLIGRRHEYFINADGTMMPWVYEPEIVVHHYGFMSSAMGAKRTGNTNLKSVLLQLEEAPEYGEFWMDAIRAHVGSPLCASGLELIDRYRWANEQGEIHHPCWHSEFRSHFYEAVFAFALDDYDRALKAASASVDISPSRDMLAVRAAVNAMRSNDALARTYMLQADLLYRKPHVMIGGSNGMSLSSKVLCFAAGAAERCGDEELAYRWYSESMCTSPTYAEGPLRFASFLAKCGREEVATELLGEALDAKPDDSGFASELVELWLSEDGLDLTDRIVEARGRWPNNPIFAGQLV